MSVEEIAIAYESKHFKDSVEKPTFTDGISAIANTGARE